ncbi:MAG: hypothetical protein RRB13_05620 [bacterium]|nr:hypothetical protein [bacterium]
MRLLLPLLFLAFMAPVSLMALGNDSANNTNSIPLPEVNFAVILTDTQNVQTSASRVSWDGKVYLQGKRGETLTTIPFEKINQLEVKTNDPAPAGGISTKVTLKSGEVIDLGVKGNSKVFGETSFGKFEIYMRDVRKVLFN